MQQGLAFGTAGSSLFTLHSSLFTLHPSLLTTLTTSITFARWNALDFAWRIKTWHQRKRLRTALNLAAAALILGTFAAGCGKGKDENSEPVPAAKLAIAGNVQQPASAGTTGSAALSPEARLHQKFNDATVQDPPDDQLLPDLTKTGKSVGRIYEKVVAEWDKVRFLTADGKKIAYTATLSTDLGDVTFELWPEIAPNHVRNFIALARAGYYDGLAFDRAVKQDDPPFESLEAGCPIGTGEPNYGSIGYWLNPEFNGKVTHAAGTIGACRTEGVESAACKFYINLSKAEWMDGGFTLFGKVSQGLDVLRAIHGRPVRDEGVRDRPVEPVVIRGVTIRALGD